MTTRIWLATLITVVVTTACQQNLFTKPPVENHQPETVVNQSVDTVSDLSEFKIVEDDKQNTFIEVEQETDTLWQRIAKGMQLQDHQAHPRVKEYIKFYSRNQRYINSVGERAEPFLFMITEQVQAGNLPAEIALLPIVESAFQPFAYSHGRAAGIWQFIPGTGKMYGLKQNWWYDGRRDVVASTKAALKYLQRLHDRFDGDWLLALAAYNSGAGNVNYAIRKNKKRGLPTDFWHLQLPRETRNYVPSLLAVSAVVANPEKYHIELPEILNEPAVTMVRTSEQIDLALFAQLADISIEQVYRLNPGFNHWATIPGQPADLLIPVEKAAIYHERLAETPKDQFIQWQRHKIKSGETLSHIAKRYQTTVKLLKDTNGINNQIRQGQHLMIPVAREALTDYALTRQQRHASRLKRHKDGNKKIIVVKKGDTLWDLSRKHKVSHYQLARWNGLAPADTLSPGKKLVLWTKKSASRQYKKSVSNTHALSRTTIRTIRYTVRKGDSLALISDKFNVTVKQLLKWNRLSRKSYLQPGQRLTLYVDVTKQS